METSSALSASGSSSAPKSLAILKRLARKPSTASLTPATMKIAKAISIWLDAIAQTMTGTSRMRPNVMMFGILNVAFPGLRPDVTQDQSFRGPDRLIVYIVYTGGACEPLHGGEIRRNHPAIIWNRT